MKTLVYGMQCSGASFVAFSLCQHPCIAIIDLYNHLEAPCLESDTDDIILKTTVSMWSTLEEQIDRFRPDKVVLVTRSIDDIMRSLSTKEFRRKGGAWPKKMARYANTLIYHIHRFDEVISYERVVRSGFEIKRTIDDILEYNCKHCEWAEQYYGLRWGFGQLDDQHGHRAGQLPGQVLNTVRVEPRI
jgi:hypothetical protein